MNPGRLIWVGIVITYSSGRAAPRPALSGVRCTRYPAPPQVQGRPGGCRQCVGVTRPVEPSASTAGCLCRQQRSPPSVEGDCAELPDSGMDFDSLGVPELAEQCRTCVPTLIEVQAR